jgi:hypothetical protein
MTDMQSGIVALLRADFGEEVRAGFPHLRTIPQTKVVQFLDYFASLGPDDQSALLDALALRGSVLFDLRAGAAFPPAPAFDRYWSAVTSQGPFTGGYRYCDVKFLTSVPKVPEFGGYEGWIENYQKPWASQLALTPREDLLPDMTCLKPAKAPLLRKLVNAALKGCGFTLEASRGAEQKYVSSAGDKVRVDFGSRMGQVCYSVSAARGSTRIVMMSYESLWSQPGGWDYITEENAARVIGLLPELVDYLIGLTERAVPRR